MEKPSSIVLKHKQDFATNNSNNFHFFFLKNFSLLNICSPHNLTKRSKGGRKRGLRHVILENSYFLIS